MNKLRTILSALFFLFCLPSPAQFYSIGDEDGHLKWMQIETPHYQVIYPRGLDSLSQVYAMQLERYWPSVGTSAGYQPGEFYHKKTPVLLHAQHGISNGSVVLAPMRMDLYTLPQAYNPGPMPWEQSLAVHESRHVSQMQFGRAKALKPFNWIFGQMFSGAMTAVYPNLHLLEGDAVVAETGLTAFGRGRESSFLQFYQNAFDEGDWRNWYRWRYGSYKHFAPDHYALGYLTIAGTRYCYDEPEFTKKYFDSVTRRPYRFNHMKRTVSQASGKKFKDSFEEITTTFHQLWTAEKEKRKPFTRSELIMTAPSWYTSYSEVCIGKDEIYALKTGKLNPCELVKIDRNGKETVLQQFSYLAGGLYLAENKLWWSESIPDPRWNLKMKSIIRYRDLETGKTHDLTSKGRYFNPCPSPDRDLIAVAEYEMDGRNNVVLLSSKDGAVRYRFRCPDGMQPAEFTWEDQTLFFNAITKEGTGLYQIKDFKISEVLSPQPVRISDLSSAGSRMYFSSDRNGVNEFYELDYHTGNIYQLISLEYSGADFSFNVAVDHLFYTIQTGEGTLLYQTPKTCLKRKLVQWDDVYEDPVSRRLTEQEKALAMETGKPWPEDSSSIRPVGTSLPKPYRKGLKIFNFHSWVPLYINSSFVTNPDFSSLMASGGIGATAFFQSPLGDAYGSIGYQYGKTGSNNHYRSSGHLMFTYKGLYPVFDFTLDFGEREVLHYYKKTFQKEGLDFLSIEGIDKGTPLLRSSISTYIPLNFSSSGWRRGLVPRLRWSFTNDVFHKGGAIYTLDNTIGGSAFGQLTGLEEGKNVFLQTLDFSLRGYSMQNTAPAKYFPDLGISGEIGWSGRLGMTDLYTSSLYSYVLGYLPGFWKNQGFKLSAIGQHQFKQEGMIGENSVHVAPRGFNQHDINRFIAPRSTDQFRLSAEYSIPIYIGDISCFSPLLYIKNLELRPYADYSFFRMNSELRNSDLYSLGSELTIHSANLLWVPYDTSIGVTCCYNGGRMMNLLKEYQYEPDHFFIGLVFRMDL